MYVGNINDNAVNVVANLLRVINNIYKTYNNFNNSKIIIYIFFVLKEFDELDGE